MNISQVKKTDINRLYPNLERDKTDTACIKRVIIGGAHPKDLSGSTGYVLKTVTVTPI